MGNNNPSAPVTIEFDSCYVWDFVRADRGVTGCQINGANSTFIVRNSVFIGNQGATNGVIVNNNGNPTIKIYNSTFRNNKGGNGGSVIYTSNTSPTITIVNSTFSENTSDGNNKDKMNIRTENGSPTVRCYNSTFFGPTAKGSGRFEFHNCIVEATNGNGADANVVNNNSYIPANNLGYDNTVDNLRNSFTLTNCGFTQVYVLNNNASGSLKTAILERPIALAVAEGTTVTADQCGNKRTAYATTLGAYEEPHVIGNVTATAEEICEGGEITLTAPATSTFSGFIIPANATYRWIKLPSTVLTPAPSTTTTTCTVNEPGKYICEVLVEGRTLAIVPSAEVILTALTSANFVWEGGGADDDWNNPANWNLAAVPSPCDNVVISATGTHLPFLEEAVSCNTIHFLPNASIGGIHNLTIKSNAADAIKVDLSLEQNRWYLLSPVLDGMSKSDLVPALPSSTDRITGHVTTHRHFAVSGNVAGWSTTAAEGDFEPGEAIAFSSALKYNFMAWLQDPTLDPININLTGKEFIIGKEQTPVTIHAHELDIVEDGNPYGHSVNYILVGNPYMSHLDLNKFYELNKSTALGDGGITSFIRYYKYENDAVSYPVHNVSSPNANAIIAPLQSFLVEIDAAAGTVQGENHTLIFDHEMSIVAVGDQYRLRSSDIVKPDRLRLQASIGESVSGEALVAAGREASNSYRLGEDASMLFSAQSQSSIDIYTMAGSRASDINRINSDSLNGLFVPVNIRTKKTGTLKLEIAGARSFYSADNVYLFDKQTDTYTSLLEQDIFDIEKTTEDNLEDRLYLVFESLRSAGGGEGTSITETGGEETIFIYGSNNNIVVKTTGEQLLSVTIYDVAGRTIQSVTGLQGTSFSSQALPAASTCIVTVVTNQKVSTKKVFIK